MENLFASIGKDSTPGIGIDESEIERFPNMFEFVTSPSGLATTILPKQAAITTTLLGEYCPRCTKESFLDLFNESSAAIRKKICFLHWGKCPRCHGTRFDFMNENENEKRLRNYNEMTLVWGQRSGKSKTAALLNVYQLYRFLSISDPIKKFGLSTGDELSITFSALTLERANRLLWSPFLGIIDMAPWFKTYHKFLKLKSKDFGYPLYEYNKTKISYNHKRIICVPTGSQDKKMRGDTRIMASVDELAYFNVDEKKKDQQSANALGTYTALTNSLATIRMKWLNLFSAKEYDLPPAIMVNVSSPSSVKDFIMQLYRKSSDDESKNLAIKAATWECNPDYTEVKLKQEYKSMADLDFKRDFGASPPINSDPLFSDPDALEKLCLNKPLGVKVSTGFIHDGEERVYLFLQDQPPEDQKPRMLTFDLGAKQNGLACAIMSMTGDKIVVDEVFVIIPNGMTIDIAKTFEHFTIPLVKRFNIKHVFFDRWNSLHQVQALKDFCKSDTRSLTFKEMKSMKSLVNSSGIYFPVLDRPFKNALEDYYVSESSHLPNPYEEILIQLLTVRDMGTYMAKPVAGDDDIFRVVALGATMLQEPAIRQFYFNASKGEKGNNPLNSKSGKSVTVSRGFSGGGSGGAGGGVVANSRVVFKSRR